MDEEFKARLKKAMDEKGISAAELSRSSGVGKSDISYYLKGKYVPKQDKCYLLAKALECDPGWLMTGFEPDDDEKRVIPIVVPDTERFVKLVHFMPEDEYQMVMAAFERAEERMREAEGEDK